MRIVSARVENYKSFFDSGDIQLTSGFNVIVGQNNVGKTALVEGLSLRFENKPHRSLKTVPDSLSVPRPLSRVRIVLELSGEELTGLLKSHFPKFYVPITMNEPAADQAQKFLRLLTRKFAFRFEYQAGQNVNEASLVPNQS